MDFTLVPGNSNTIVGVLLLFPDMNPASKKQTEGQGAVVLMGIYAGLNFTNYGRNDEVKYGLELTDSVRNLSL